jgi:hypothetical protein
MAAKAVGKMWLDGEGPSRVGTGLTRSEETEVLDRLLGADGFSVSSGKLVAGCRGSAPPCYKVTGHPDEWPEWWIANPHKSVVLQVWFDCQ